MLSETVIISLITFASGAFGAICGFFGTWLSSKKQIESSIRESYFSARLNAYQSYYDHYVAFIRNPNDAQCYTELLNSISHARLVASAETSLLFQKVALEMSDVQPPNLPSMESQILRGKLLEAMQNDLKSPLNR